MSKQANGYTVFLKTGMCVFVDADEVVIQGDGPAAMVVFLAGERREPVAGFPLAGIQGWRKG